MEQLMSFKKWFFLLLLEITYLLLGASFFYQIESVEEAKRHQAEKIERVEIEELLLLHYQPSPNSSQDEIFQRLTDYCGKPVHTKMSHEDPPNRWDFYHSLFFVITVCSTIGYGNLAPTTMLGRIVMIFYGLVGIPVNGIVMVTLGGYFAKRITSLYNRWKTDKIHDMTANLGLVGQITIYLLPGFFLLIFLPSVAIMIFEGWDYDVAVYYAFVTLTTIGFGDYVAGVQDNHFGDFLFTTYKIFLLVWIIIGLGYIVMVLGFISRGMRSKKIVEMEQLLVDNIRRTPIKFKALKSMIYEILLMRLKPVYKKNSCVPIYHTGRAASLPDLRLLCNDFPTYACRKRALSETNTKDLPTIQRVKSDSNLHLIDKDLTFLSTNFKREKQQNDLLRKMSAFVNSYESKLNQAHGIDCMSDDEILESEQYCSMDYSAPIWTIGNSTIKEPTTKSMKFSDTLTLNSPYEIHSNEATWYGQTAALKEQEMREKLKHGRARSRTLPVQQEPLLKLPQVGLISRLRRRFISTAVDKDKDKDIEKGDLPSPSIVPQIPTLKELRTERTRKRTQSESFAKSRANDLTMEEKKQVEQLASWLFTIVDQSEPRRKVGNVTPPDFSTLQFGRLPSSPNTNVPNVSGTRKGSLMPPSPSQFHSRRRFSLNPVEDINQPPISPTLSLNTQRRFSLRPSLNISNTPSPVIRRIRKDTNKDCVIIEHEQMK